MSMEVEIIYPVNEFPASHIMTCVTMMADVHIGGAYFNRKDLTNVKLWKIMILKPDPFWTVV